MRRRYRRENPLPLLIPAVLVVGVGVMLLAWGGSAAMTAITGPTPPTTPTPAGVYWLQFWPTGKTTAGLTQPFRGSVERAITATEAAGGHAAIRATNRPYERAWLMHYAWRVGHGLTRPEDVPAYPGINIIWTVPGALEMIKGYGLAVEPVLNSRHIPVPPSTTGLAIDMEVTFPHATTMIDAHGAPHAIAPGSGNVNPVYNAIMATYGVHKLAGDEPHYSVDGH